MHGSPKHQAKQIIKAMDGTNESRHSDKAMAREKGARGSHEIAKATKVHSYSYEKSIKGTVQDFLNFQADNFLGKGRANAEAINQDQVVAYLDHKMCTVSVETFDGICTHMARFETALENRTGREYNLWESIQSERHYAKEIMPETVRESRYQSVDNRDRIIDNITNNDFRFAAEVMRESGMRIHEVSTLGQGIDQYGNWHGLRGIHPDPITGTMKGYMDVQGKGGKWRVAEMSVATYHELERRLGESKNNRLDSSESSLSRAFQHAADKANIEIDGTHDFRHSWYQDRVYELVEAGIDFDHAVEIADHEMGHERCMWDVYGR